MFPWLHKLLPVAFEAPHFLWLLLLLVPLWLSSFRHLQALGRLRRLSALGLRSIVYVLLVMALARPQWVQRHDKLTVIYLLDQSLSIPADERTSKIRWVNAAIREHRRQGDRVGVIVFGRDAALEIPPVNQPVEIPERIEAPIDPEFTSLEAAMKLALASFPEDAARRIVIVSDGNQNLGNALEQAEVLRDQGISIDVVPVRYRDSGEVVVEKLSVPTDIRVGQPFDLHAVVTNRAAQPVTGRLVFRARRGDAAVVLNPPAEEGPNPQIVTLKPGKNVYTLRQTLTEANFYTYEAEFFPAAPEDDEFAQNNRAATFVHVRGKARVLVIESAHRRGQHTRFLQALQSARDDQGQPLLEVHVVGSDQAFSSLAELQQYDAVILANVPRAGGASGVDQDTSRLAGFTDSQIDMLVSNTHDFGCGLILLGGDESFGAGGWANTALERAMPLDFHITNAKVVPKGALCIIMHASELAQGNYWQKVIGREALNTLAAHDYAAVVEWNGNVRWLWGAGNRGFLPVGPNRTRMLARLDQMFPGDMPDFDSSMVLALQGFNSLTDAAVKHMIIISDGDPSPPSNTVLQAYVRAGITISTVAVGTHGPADSRVLRDVATRTGGKYYAVRNNNALPRIFQKEAMQVSRPLIFEQPDPWQPALAYPHEMLAGIPRDAPLPPITGYVMTTVKPGALPLVAMQSPLPQGRENAILATWTYGLGKAVCFTTDAGHRWAQAWTAWEHYDRFFTQLVKWALRPGGDTGNYVLEVDAAEGRGELVVTALDDEGNFRNNLAISGKVVAPDGTRLDVDVRQVAPGRYVADFPAAQAGSYYVVLVPEPGKAPLLAGLNVPYSPEFRQRETDENLLRTLAGMAPRGAPPGAWIEPPPGTPGEQLAAFLRFNSFRHDLPPATSAQPAWHLVVWLGGLLFFADVFVRRVHVDFRFVGRGLARLRDFVLRRAPAPPPAEHLARLRSRKAEVTTALEQRRTAARFEPTRDVPADADTLAELLRQQPVVSTPQPPTPSLEPEQERDTYTARLLKAKQEARRKKPPS
jgi:uncharacterized membrane protein/Mg-chelatase subunit ChlD